MGADKERCVAGRYAGIPCVLQSSDEKVLERAPAPIGRAVPLHSAGSIDTHIALH